MKNENKIGLNTYTIEIETFQGIKSLSDSATIFIRDNDTDKFIGTIHIFRSTCDNSLMVFGNASNKRIKTLPTAKPTIQ